MPDEALKAFNLFNIIDKVNNATLKKILVAAIHNPLRLKNKRYKKEKTAQKKEKRFRVISLSENTAS